MDPPSNPVVPEFLYESRTNEFAAVNAYSTPSEWSASSTGSASRSRPSRCSRRHRPLPPADPVSSTGARCSPALARTGTASTRKPKCCRRDQRRAGRPTPFRPRRPQPERGHPGKPQRAARHRLRRAGDLARVLPRADHRLDNELEFPFAHSAGDALRSDQVRSGLRAGLWRRDQRGRPLHTFPGHDPRAPPRSPRREWLGVAGPARDGPGLLDGLARRPGL